MNTYITIIGNIVADPVISESSNGKAWMRFPVYSTQPASPDGRYPEKTSKYQVRVFNGIVASAQRILTKGMPVVIYGELSTEEYTREDGSKGQSTNVRALSVGVNTIGLQSVQRTAPKAAPKQSIPEDTFAEEAL
jgi:single-strand DNA-binding protein